MLQPLALETMLGGAALEAFDHELSNVFRNIVDPNTAAKAMRQVTLTVKLKPNEKRNSLDISFQVVPKLAPVEALTTEALIEVARDGTIAVMEVFRSQEGDRTVLPGCEGNAITINPFDRETRKEAQSA